jgi:hypothetical protein
MITTEKNLWVETTQQFGLLSQNNDESNIPSRICVQRFCGFMTCSMFNEHEMACYQFGKISHEESLVHSLHALL